MARLTSPFFSPVKVFGMVVLALMALSIGYAACIAIWNWSGIGV